jgi:hypothetical protein
MTRLVDQLARELHIVDGALTPEAAIAANHRKRLDRAASDGQDRGRHHQPPHRTSSPEVRQIWLVLTY